MSKKADENAAIEKERQLKKDAADKRANETAQQAFVRACEELRANKIGMEQNEMKKRQTDLEVMKQQAKPYWDHAFKHGKEFWSGAHAGYDQWESIMSNLNSLNQDFSEALMMQSPIMHKQLYHMIGDRFKASPTNPQTLPDFKYDIEIDKNNCLNIKSLTCDGGKDVELPVFMGFQALAFDWLDKQDYALTKESKESSKHFQFCHKDSNELLTSETFSTMKSNFQAYLNEIRDSQEQEISIRPKC